jgi:hypothetical protein
MACVVTVFRYQCFWLKRFTMLLWPTAYAGVYRMQSAACPSTCFISETANLVFDGGELHFIA